MSTTRPRAHASWDTLLTATSHGDAVAFASLYDAASPLVHARALRVLRDTHHSEDVTQDVFLHVWTHATRFEPSRGSAHAWLMSVSHHKAVDRVRRTESARRRDAHDLQGLHRADQDLTADAVHAAMDAQAVRSALQQLSPLQRHALELTYYGGHTHLEVSTHLGVPLGTAKARIRDGIARLRDQLVPVPVHA